MKIHKIVLLAGLSILPMQGLLAAGANNERLVQPITSKATIVMPEQKLSPVAPGKKQGGEIAGPGGAATGHTKPVVVQRDSAIAKMGVNLKLLSVKWDDEICTQGCPDFRSLGLSLGYASCDLAFRVTNTGDVASGNFRVRLLRTIHTGTEVPLDISNGLYKLAPHETKTFTIDRVSLGLYTLGRPFTVTLDPINQIAETNENDNSATFLPQ
ncbi:MAG: hypothetical protein COA63_009035 [Methylophaga sp.]|nr:hypothetical protein [Methylophaga sp.]